MYHFYLKLKYKVAESKGQIPSTPRTVTVQGVGVEHIYDRGADGA